MTDPREAAVLAVITRAAKAGARTPSLVSLAEIAGIRSDTTASHIVGRLVAQGLVIRAGKASHQRTYRLPTGEETKPAPRDLFVAHGRGYQDVVYRDVKWPKGTRFEDDPRAVRDHGSYGRFSPSHARSLTGCSGAWVAAEGDHGGAW